VLENTQQSNFQFGESAGADREKQKASPRLCGCGCKKPMPPNIRYSRLPWHRVRPPQWKKCKGCGNDFLSRGRRRQFCSIQCYWNTGARTARSESLAKEGNFSPKIKVNCPCGNTFETSSHRPAKYCNASCFHKYRGKAGEYGKSVERICPVCGKHFKVSAYRQRTRPAGFRHCSMKCAGVARRRASAQKPTTHRWRQRQRLIALRGAKCEDCGFDRVPEIIQVHHLDGNPCNPEHSNLLLLCPNCHDIRHFKAGTGRFTTRASRLRRHRDFGKSQRHIESKGTYQTPI